SFEGAEPRSLPECKTKREWNGGRANPKCAASRGSRRILLGREERGVEYVSTAIRCRHRKRGRRPPGLRLAQLLASASGRLEQGLLLDELALPSHRWESVGIRGQAGPVQPQEGARRVLERARAQTF